MFQSVTVAFPNYKCTTKSHIMQTLIRKITVEGAAFPHAVSQRQPPGVQPLLGVAAVLCLLTKTGLSQSTYLGAQPHSLKMTA